MTNEMPLLPGERWMFDPLASGYGWMLLTPCGYMARIRGTGPVQTSLPMGDTRTAYLAHRVYERNMNHRRAQLQALTSVPRATIDGCRDHTAEPILEPSPILQEGIWS